MRALTGRATGAVACTVSGKPALRGAAAAALIDGLRLDWGKGLGRTAEQAAGLTVAVSDPIAGWRYAHWFVSHARDTGLERVRFVDLEWHAPSGKWQNVTGDAVAGNATVVAEVFQLRLRAGGPLIESLSVLCTDGASRSATYIGTWTHSNATGTS